MKKFIKWLFNNRKPIEYDYNHYDDYFGYNERYVISKELEELKRLESLKETNPLMYRLSIHRIGYLKELVRKENIKGFESLL